ncbi:MAG: ribosome silencing factor [bacterium]|nr:ribosome silencing factor [bacterium]
MSAQNQNPGEASPVEKTSDASELNTADLAQKLFVFLEDKKASDVVLMDLEHVNPYFSIFLIATANSQVQLKSLVRDITKKFGSALPTKTGGMRPDDVASGWVIIDFIDVVVHLFIKEQRDFYNLERLWGDGVVVQRSEADPARAQTFEDSGGDAFYRE